MFSVTTSWSKSKKINISFCKTYVSIGTTMLALVLRSVIKIIYDLLKK